MTVGLNYAGLSGLQKRKKKTHKTKQQPLKKKKTSYFFQKCLRPLPPHTHMTEIQQFMICSKRTESMIPLTWKDLK